MRLTRNQLYSLQGTGGSNPSLSAIYNKPSLAEGFVVNDEEGRFEATVPWDRGPEKTP